MADPPTSSETPSNKRPQPPLESVGPRAAKSPLPPPPPKKSRRSSREALKVAESELPIRPLWAFWRDRAGRRHASSFVGSLVTHLLLLIGLTLFFVEQVGTGGTLTVAGSIDSDSVDLEQFDLSVNIDRSEQTSESMQINVAEIDLPHPEAPTVGAPSESTPIPTATMAAATFSNLQGMSELPSGGGWSGRSEGERQALLDREGGTAGSEAAVERGLEWLAAHQHEDGSWWFDLSRGPCRGRCRHPGVVGSSTAATGLAVLCFLGHGETPDQGKHQETVRRGIYYLQNRVKFGPKGGDLQEGSMYGHAIATLAMTEAYGMTQDASLRPIAQKCLDFIVASQHSAGGWRYNPGQPGDMTVSGWQLMALHSGHLAGLEAPSPSLISFNRFLDALQTHAGARYRYLPERDESTPVPTAVGLLCRMYLGWPHNITPLREGTKYLADLGPSRTDLYFNYYATQVLHHFGEPHWEGWNERMRDYLVRTQEQSGHEAGSWHFPDEHGDTAGRLYSTAMAIMILEVYYRHLPLYGDRAVDFPY